MINDTADISAILADAFPFWSGLTDAQRASLSSSARFKSFTKDSAVHRGGEDCVGLVLVLKGQLRVYILSEEGRELTLYRLLERDICLFSASCVFNGISFEVMVSAQEDTDTVIIPASVFKGLMDESAAAAMYANRLMASHFSEVMWLLDQIQNKKLDSRLASLLLEERGLENSDLLELTHEQLGNHLGSPREVVTRMLKYFQSEGMVKLGRGSISITDEEGLRRLSENGRR